MVAKRTQLPFVPGAARTATSTLSATVHRMAHRIVVHCTHGPHTILSDEAHIAPLFIALTRVVNAADIAVSTGTKIRANVSGGTLLWCHSGEPFIYMCTDETCNPKQVIPTFVYSTWYVCTQLGMQPDSTNTSDEADTFTHESWCMKHVLT